MIRSLAAAALLASLLSTSAWAQSTPDPVTTPGAINPAVTQANIGATICVRGWTATVRPDEEFTYYLKREQLTAYHYVDRRTRDYEEDHLIPLELGGSPDSRANLWPEPRESPDGWTAAVKDRLENRLNQLVCQGQLPLAVAQQAIAVNWPAAFRRYVGSAAISQVAPGSYFDGLAARLNRRFGSPF
ncbi:MAG: hypothetical protein ACRYHQ_30915 [Janthinobacterium lividum]